jgi:hypothetical protein
VAVVQATTHALAVKEEAIIKRMVDVVDLPHEGEAA